MVRPLNALGEGRRLERGGGGEHDRGPYTSGKGVRGSPPEKFEINMSLEAILMHFETIFACAIWLIVQAFHVAVFKCFSNPRH